MKKTKTTKRANRKPFVYYDTIRNQTRGGLSAPGVKQLRIGKYRVGIARAPRLDYYGNPVHTAWVYDADGNVLSSYRSNGSAELTVSTALKRCGVETKRKNAGKTRR